MPVLLGVLYLGGLAGLAALASYAGKKKAEREGSSFGFDKELPAITSRAWYAILLRQRSTGRYAWSAPQYLTFQESVDYSMKWSPVQYQKDLFTWNGSKWVRT